MILRLFSILIPTFLLLPAVAAEEAGWGDVLTAELGYDADPKRMMQTFLLDETGKKKAEWRKSYENVKTPENIRQYQTERVEFLRRGLGKTWEKTPLNAAVTKTLRPDAPGTYTVEMVVFESVPKFFVTGAVFLPDPAKFKPPYPALLVVCGHSHTGKARDLYQKVPALAASNGLLAMSIDPIDQGERSQRLTPESKPVAQGVAAHNVIGAGSILLGRNAATFEFWDMVRALDYLQSRPDVLGDKIGVAGTSGGGTQSSYIMTLDDRIAAAAPSCYLCDLFDLVGGLGPQDAEQNIFGQLGFGLDHADYAILRAPKPTLIGTTTEDFFPVEGAWSAFRNAKRIYDRLGYAERAGIVEAEGKHGWPRTLREGTVRWMLRWLAGRDETIVEAEDLPIFKTEEFLATPRGEVMLLDGARSAFDLNRDYNDELLAQRKSKNTARSEAERIDTIRKTAGIRPLDSIPKPTIEEKGRVELPESLAAVAADAVRVLFHVEDDRVVLPGIRFLPKGESKGVSIFLHEKGKTADPAEIARLIRSGRTVLAVDLRGLGETQAVGPKYYRHEMFGTDGTDYYRAYLLGRSYVGMRTEDLLTVARWVAGATGQNPVEIVASGETVGMVALHAGTVEPSLISGIRLDRPIRSWHGTVKLGDAPYPITNLVHGSLLEYDVPDLRTPVIRENR